MNHTSANNESSPISSSKGSYRNSNSGGNVTNDAFDDLLQLLNVTSSTNQLNSPTDQDKSTPKPTSINLIKTAKNLSHSSPNLCSSCSDLDADSDCLLGAVGGVTTANGRSFLDDSSSDEDPETDTISGENFVEYAEIAMEQRVKQQNNVGGTGENIAIDDELLLLTLFDQSTMNLPKRNLTRQIGNVFIDPARNSANFENDERIDRMLNFRNNSLSNSSSAPLIRKFAAAIQKQDSGANNRNSADIQGIDFHTFEPIRSTSDNQSVPGRKFLARAKATNCVTPTTNEIFYNDLFSPITSSSSNSSSETPIFMPSFQPTLVTKSENQKTASTITKENKRNNNADRYSTFSLQDDDLFANFSSISLENAKSDAKRETKTNSERPNSS